MSEANRPPLSDEQKLKRQLLLEQQKRKQAEEQLAQAKQTPAANAEAKANGNNNGGRGLLTALVIFMGSLFGSLIGTFASVNDLFESLERIETIVNPPVQLCVAGSNTILGEGITMAAEWEADFESTRRVDVSINGTGSLGGVQLAALGGCVHVLAMSEAMPPAEEQILLDNGIEIQCAVEIGYDVIAFVTDSNNNLPSLLERLMRNVLTGGLHRWSDVRGYDLPIYIYVRPGSGTTDYVLKRFGWTQGAAQLPPNANYIPCGTNDACLDSTLGTPGSLYWVSTAWMRTQPPQYIRVLPILRGDESAINPLRDDFNIDEYPDKLIRALYMYVLRTPGMSDDTSQMAQEFLAYVRGVNGQAILESHSFYNHFNRPDRVPLEFPASFGTVDLAQVPRRVCK